MTFYFFDFIVYFILLPPNLSISSLLLLFFKTSQLLLFLLEIDLLPLFLLKVNLLGNLVIFNIEMS